MGTYINLKVLGYFVSAVKNQVEGRSNFYRHCQRRYKCGKIDLDASHRALRIMTKNDYLIAKKEGNYIDYIVTPKGIALYDSLIIYSRPS